MFSDTDSSSTTDDHALLLAWLATHDAPCPACKYNLRNLTVPRCPECGRPLSLSVAVVEPYLRTWIAATILLCSNAGFGVFCLLGMSISYLRLGHIDLPPQWCYRIAIFFYSSTVPTAAASLLLRQRFVRLNPPVQSAILLVVCILTFGPFAIVLYNLLH